MCRGGFLFVEFLQAAALVIAVSIDAFAASFGYGVNRVKIPFISAQVINIICASLLAAALFLGSISRSVLPPEAAAWIGFSILFILGVTKLFDSFIKRMIKSGKQFGKLKFKLFSLNFILHVYAEPEQADIDASRILSPKEAVYLATALSLDGLSVGFGAGLSGANPVMVIVLSVILCYLAIVSGAFLGRRVAEKLTLDLSWFSGALLIALAFLRLI
jgi:putative sporulation protein YtaF